MFLETAAEPVEESWLLRKIRCQTYRKPGSEAKSILCFISPHKTLDKPFVICWWVLICSQRMLPFLILSLSVKLSHVQLWDSIDYSPPGSSIRGIFQARILEWVALSSSKRSSQTKDWTRISWFSYTAARFFTTEPPGKPYHFLSQIADSVFKFNYPRYSSPNNFIVFEKKDK